MDLNWDSQLLCVLPNLFVTQFFCVRIELIIIPIIIPTSQGYCKT
jgi:hypothetical protein